MKRDLKFLIFVWINRKFGYEIWNYKNGFPPDFDKKSIATISKVKNYTSTSGERIYGLCKATEYVVQNKIAGDIVECGVWRGGSMMAVADILLKSKDTERNLFLYDTFAGMPEPSEKDISFWEEPADWTWRKLKRDNHSTWCYAPLEEVQKNMQKVGYPKEKIHYVKGMVEDTIPDTAPEKISLLRLDTDWYNSVKHELIHLFPRLSAGGVIIIDDYGHWQGARKATDEYLVENNIKLLLNRMDYTARIGVKAC